MIKCVTFFGFCLIKASVCVCGHMCDNSALLINGKLKSIGDFFAFCKVMKEFTINLTNLYSPSNGAHYNQVF